MSEETTVDEVPATQAIPAFEPFALVKERVLFVNMNIRAENHGDEKEPACDLKFELSAPNSILKKIRPGLLESFYEGDRQQADIEGDFLRKLKHPQIGALSYDWEIPRTVLRIHDATDEFQDVVLGGGKTNKFRLTMLDGGTVKIGFRCQFSKPDEDSIAALMRVLSQNVPISLTSEEEEVKADNFEQADLLSQAPHSEARAEAEALFKSAPTPEDIVNAETWPTTDPAAEASNVEPIKGRRSKTA